MPRDTALGFQRLGFGSSNLPLPANCGVHHGVCVMSLEEVTLGIDIAILIILAVWSSLDLYDIYFRKKDKKTEDD